MRTLSSFVSNFLFGIAVLAGAVLLGGHALAQDPPNKPAWVPAKPAGPAGSAKTPRVSQAVTEDVIYRFFFEHVENLDHVAEKLESEGKNGDGFRTHDQRLAGLTEDEGAMMKQVAYACNQAMKEQDAKVQAARKAYRTQSPGGGTPTASAPEVTQALDERKEAINSYIAQLRAMLGESSFLKLDGYVKNLIQPTTVKPK